MAKVFKSGNSQAVRLPREFRLDVDEVEISREGDVIMLRPVRRGLSEVLEIFAAMPADFFAEGRVDEPPQKREPLE